jgi:hypothetical protein
VTRHPKKEVQDAVEEAERLGWRFEASGGHAWGRGYCPCGECRIISVWSTPANAGNHAKQILRAARRCPMSEEV